MKKGKITAFILAAVIICGAFALTAFAADKSVDVYVTVSAGSLALTHEKLTVTDTDGDGALTVNDALYLAHEAKYKGGAAAGYGTENSIYGLSMTKLWGVSNGGSYGYYVNNKSAMSLTEALKDGDIIDAFAYTDTSAYSDVYCYFNISTVSAKKGDTVELTLSAAGFDASWNPITLPVSGAEITIDGKSTGIKTDDNGKATVTLNKSGVISAKSNSQTLVPPVCMATVESAGINFIWYIVIALVAVAVIAAVIVIIKKKK